MNLLSKISELVELSDEAKAWIQQHSKSISLAKGEILLREGQLCQYLYFVKSGILSASYYEKDKEVCSWISLQNEFATSYFSFISSQPAEESVVALQETEVDAIHKNKLKELYDLFPETNRAGRLILENYYVRMEEHLIALRSKSALERYELLFESRPEIFKYVPLGRIASYLGMSQETLSRIRAKG